MRDVDCMYDVEMINRPLYEGGSGEVELITSKGRRVKPPKNGVFIIYPKRSKFGVWSFTDEAADLEDEPFVGEINNMIDWLVKDIKGASKGFILYFSDQPIPKAQLSFTLVKSEVEFENEVGATYICNELSVEGWLCPALFCYFADRPQNIYVRAEKARK